MDFFWGIFGVLALVVVGLLATQVGPEAGQRPGCARGSGRQLCCC